MNNTLYALAVRTPRALTIEQLKALTGYTKPVVMHEIAQAGTQIERLEDGRYKARYFGVKET